VKSLLISHPMLRLGVAASTLLPASTLAASTTAPNCTTTNPAGSATPLTDGSNCAQSSDSPNSLFGSAGIFHTIANVMIYVVGAIAVIMLIIGGLRYVISQGDKGNVESAKNTILYAVIGIVIAVLAYAIVNFVSASLTGGTPNAQ
jgi:glucose uptake protein GlcU